MNEETTEQEVRVVEVPANISWQHRAALESIKMLVGGVAGYLLLVAIYIVCSGIVRSMDEARKAAEVFAGVYGIGVAEATIPVSNEAMDSSALERIIDAAGRKHNVDPDLLRAVARTESSERPFASNQGALGLMQLRPDTRRYFGISDAEALDPHISIDRGAEWLAIKIAEQDDDVEEAVQSYFCGTSRKTCINRPRGKSYLAKVAQNYVDIKAEKLGDA